LIFYLRIPQVEDFCNDKKGKVENKKINIFLGKSPLHVNPFHNKGCKYVKYLLEDADSKFINIFKNKEYFIYLP
jgi:hypothetical protein